MHMAQHPGPTIEDSLGCLSLCAELDADYRPQSKGDAAIRQHTTFHSEHSPAPLYFCLEPDCNTPSHSAADHSCSRLSISGTLCEEHDLDTLPIMDYPSEKFPAFDNRVVEYADLERQVCERTYTLRRPASSTGWSGRYQTTLWFLSNRPRDSALIFLGLFIAFTAALALVALVGLTFLGMRGELTAFNNYIDGSLALIHGSIIGFLRGFEELQPTHVTTQFSG